MSGELSAQALIDFRKATLKSIPVVTIVSPDATITRRYSMVGSPLTSSMGIFRDRIKSIGDIDYRLSDPRGGLQSVTVAFHIADLDGDLRAIVGRYGIRALVGGSVTVHYATASAYADWPVLFTGVVDGVDPSENGWDFLARVDDRAMVDAAYRIPRITSLDFPLATADHLEKPIPVILGLFDSRDGTTSWPQGAIQLIRLGEVASGSYPYKFLLCAGWASHVSRGSTDEANGATVDWTRTYSTRGGKNVTEVWFAVDPDSGVRGSPARFADVQGIGEDAAGFPSYTGAAGTGPPMRNPIKQVRWLLRNYAWSSYRSGAFAGDPAAIDVTSWDAAEAWAEQRRYRGSILIAEAGQKPVDTFNALCRWAWIRAGWNRLGKLCLHPFAPEQAPYQDGTRWVRRPPKGAEWQFMRSYPRDRAAQTVRSPSWFVQSGSSERSSVVVRDPRTAAGIITDVSAPLGVARQAFAANGYPYIPMLALHGSKPGYQGDSVYATHNGALARWRDQSWGPLYSQVTEFPTNVRVETTMMAPVGNEPTWVNGALNGHGYVRFDGVNDYMNTLNPFSGAVQLLDYHFTIFVVFRCSGATAAGAAAPEADGLLVDPNAYWGLYTYASGGLYYLRGLTWDATAGAYKVLNTQISLNTWYIARFQQSNPTAVVGGANYLSVDNWSHQTIAAAPRGSSNGTARIGRSNYAKYFQGDIAAVLMYQGGSLHSGFGGPELGAAMTPLGGNYDVYSELKDRYAL